MRCYFLSPYDTLWRRKISLVGNIGKTEKMCNKIKCLAIKLIFDTKIESFIVA